MYDNRPLVQLAQSQIVDRIVRASVESRVTAVEARATTLETRATALETRATATETFARDHQHPGVMLGPSKTPKAPAAP